jgi:mitogen-activated protein kinase 1/3/mitogen-activated protein kinase 6
MSTNTFGVKTDCYLAAGTKFDVERRYRLFDTINHGAYGVVCQAQDTQEGESVAIKKFEGIFEHIAIAKRTLRELRIMRHLKHENIMQVKSIFMTGSKDNFEDIYMVSELMEVDLDTTIHSDEILSSEHVEFFLYQILRGMKYVHSAQVIHRDLKPRNLLVNQNCDLKIRDFAIARVTCCDQWECPMTGYVSTRWYRAPEVLCSWSRYSSAIDVWSIGCILAEMVSRRPLFPGINTMDQLDLIIRLLGLPQAEELMKIPNEKCRNFIQSLTVASGMSFPDFFADMELSVQDLLSKMLQWDPEERFTVEEAIQHPYLQGLYCPDDEPTREPVDGSDFEFERPDVTTVAELREEIFREALQYYTDKLQFQDDSTFSELGTGPVLHLIQ